MNDLEKIKYINQVNIFRTFQDDISNFQELGRTDGAPHLLNQIQNVLKMNAGSFNVSLAEKYQKELTESYEGRYEDLKRLIGPNLEDSIYKIFWFKILIDREKGLC